ncbi:hypothetical protein S40293_11204 [Stachybotrys chartarum IBT 40293]|nr:hypothetical protein S40293_11204 [Stachybotrys chartarum IBT 40293]KFA75790.1 hypothetical protein S40288_11572 [Stachybotrys chartarum IBT 40288]
MAEEISFPLWSVASWSVEKVFQSDKDRIKEGSGVSISVVFIKRKPEDKRVHAFLKTNGGGRSTSFVKIAEIGKVFEKSALRGRGNSGIVLRHDMGTEGPFPYQDM